jgi:hypothetical protein
MREPAALTAIFALFAAPYVIDPNTTAWRYVLADAAIGVVAALAFGRAALRRLGLAIPPRHLAAAVIAFFAVVAAAQPVVGAIEEAQQLQILDPQRWFSLSQVLHQELVLRAVLLGLLCRWIPSRPVVGVAGAAIFATTHVALYGIFEGTLLPLVAVATLATFALATLATFALATNLLFLEFGHIGFSFAAHAGWNVSRFGGAYLLPGHAVSEVESFALIEGSPVALAMAAALLCAALATSLLRARAAAGPEKGGMG